MKALTIDPEYAPAHGALGYIADSELDLASAAQHFQRALGIDPADLDVLRSSATLLADLGRLHEALALDEAVARRDPVNVSALFNLGNHQRYASQFDSAIATYRTVLSLAPGTGSRSTRAATASIARTRSALAARRPSPSAPHAHFHNCVTANPRFIDAGAFGELTTV